ncbi:NTP transferase domain-containing protein [Chryseolinea lacunae]|uniref:NTP transferase domain-containing protein n=1 Tax=Chryseolinea lacunae TaxID=2801331 RepID=A0ABS1KZU0_9BACT|nr:NTP transferase domain-containing protein [Chryseolinea lacunae]MBL0744782.1 NTP transferase domain-containing protein [Chryseolinea lacunae]
MSGGKSTRMGKDKGLILYHDGKPQRQHVFDLLSGCCENVYISCRPEQRVAEALQPLEDHYAFDGPINGILSAFHRHPDKAWLVMAIDLPNITAATLQILLSHRNPTRLATCFLDVKAGAPEPMLALWEPAAFPRLLKNAKAGNISPRAFLKTEDVTRIESQDENLFLNVNYPEQMKEAGGS